jgi:hypothetical protein
MDRAWVYIPCPPYTVIAKDVVRHVVVQLVDVTPPKSTSPDQPGSAAAFLKWVVDNAFKEATAGDLDNAEDVPKDKRSAALMAVQALTTKSLDVRTLGSGRVKVILPADSELTTVAAAATILQARTDKPAIGTRATTAIEVLKSTQ